MTPAAERPAADLELSLRSAGADGVFAAEMRFVSSEGAAVAVLARGANVLLDAAARAGLLALTSDPAAYGAQLSEVLFADPRLREGLARARAQAAGARAQLRVRLRPDAAPELHALAWETLYDPAAAVAPGEEPYLFADERVLLSRYLDSDDMTAVERRPQTEVTALVAVADPVDAAAYGLAPVDAAGEVARAQEALRGIPVAVLARVHDGTPATLANLAAALRGSAGAPGPDVLYLVCHGGRERDAGTGLPGPPFLCLERSDGHRDPVSAADFVRALAVLPRRPALVVLAACQSAGRTHDAGALAAAGPRLAAAGVGAVVAMQTDVTTDTVKELIPEFFRELLQDGLVDRALAAARAAVFAKRPDWWAPVLYLRLSDGRLWATPVAPDRPHDVAGLDDPYLGLKAFTYAERERYAGREDAVAEAVARLTAAGEARALLFVTGASGSGKSSFAQAGVLPALEEHYQGLQSLTRRVDFRPGKRPLAALAEALVRSGLPRAAVDDPLGTIGTPDALAAFVRHGTAPGQVNLIVLDQFEELFTQSDPGERDALIAILSGLPPFAELSTHIVATLRSDYLGDLFRSPALYDLATGEGLILREMSAAELRAAIERPLRSAARGDPHYRGDPRYRGKSWEPVLVEELARQTAPSAAYLPLLQLTLTELWRREHLTLEAFRRIGGTLTGTIEERAETVLAFADHDRSHPTRRRPEADQHIVLRLLLDLVQVSVESSESTNQPDVRRRCPRAELEREIPGEASGARARLIDDLVAARLLSLSVERTDAGTIPYVDLIHETLIANWRRLRQAVDTGREALRRRARFQLAVEEWLASGKAAAYLLVGVRLADARALDASHDVALRAAAARELFRLSEGREQEARERALLEEHRANQRLRRRNVGLVVLAAGAVVAAALALWQRGVAEAQTRTAQEQTVLATSRQLAAQATTLFANQLDLGMLLGLQAYRVSHTVEARDSLLSGLQHSPLPVTFLHGHGGAVSGVAFSPDGHTLASAGKDGTVRLWDVATRARRGAPLTGHSGAVLGVAYGPGGTLASAGEDGTVRLWDVAGHRPLGAPLTGHGDAVLGVAFSPDGRTLASAGQDRTVRLWDVAGHSPIGAPLTGHGGAVLGVAFSPDGQTLASTGKDDAIRLWDVAGHASLGEPLMGHSGEVFGAAFSPDGTLASAGGNTVRLWDVATRAHRGEALTGHGANLVLGVAFSPDGRTLASAGGTTVRLWDVATSGPPTERVGGTLTGHTSSVLGIAFSPDGQVLASAGEDGTVRLWDVAGRGAIGEMLGRHGGQLVRSVAFSPDGRTLASAGGSVRLWDVAKREPLGGPLEGHAESVRGVAFSPDGRTLASAGEDGTIRLWDVAGRKPVGEPLLGHAGQVFGVAFSPDGRTLGSAGEDGTVRLWDVAGRRPPGAPLTGHTGQVFGVAFSPDGRTLASAGEDGTVRLWDVAGRKSLGEPLRGHAEAVRGVAFSPDGRTLASAGGGIEDKTVRLWDVATRQPLGSPLIGHTALVRGVAFSPDGQILASAGGLPVDKTVRLWDVATHRPLGSPLTGHTGWVAGVAFSPDSRTLASAGEDGTVRLWDIDVASWQARACRLANRNLTQNEWTQYLGNRPYARTCPDLPAGDGAGG